MTGKVIILLCLLAFATGTGFKMPENAPMPVVKYKPISPILSKEQRLTSLENKVNRQNAEIKQTFSKITE